MDRLDAMSVVLTVVEAGSLSAASRRLGIPLATVSRRISELEAHLKTRLLVRSTRRIALTDAGRSYVEACKRILGEIEEAERVATAEHQAPRGDLTVTAPLVFGRIHVVPVAVEFLATYPEINLRLVLSDRILNLIEDKIDVAVRIGVLPSSNLIATRIGATRRVVCASPAYLAARGRPERPEDLRSHDCITFENLASAQAWSFKRGKRERAVPIHSRIAVNTAEGAIDAAAAGLGLTRVLSYMIDDARRGGTLEIVLEKFEPPAWSVNLVYAQKGFIPLKLRAFLDWATPRLKARVTP
jgi:DNA-binding transcriptional LysR family regulator